MSEGSDPTIHFGTQDSTLSLPPATERLPNPGFIGLMFLSVAAAAFLIGIAIASALRPAAPGTVIASQRVGPTGGTIRFEAGEIRVPSGAVASPVRIVVRRTAVAERVRVRPPQGPLVVFNPGELVAYAFEPTDLTFARPVSILFRPRKRSGSAAVFARVRNTTLLLSDHVDPERRTVTIEARDFRFDRGQPAGAE